MAAASAAHTCPGLSLDLGNEDDDPGLCEEAAELLYACCRDAHTSGRPAPSSDATSKFLHCVWRAAHSLDKEYKELTYSPLGFESLTVLSALRWVLPLTKLKCNSLTASAYFSSWPFHGRLEIDVDRSLTLCQLG